MISEEESDEFSPIMLGVVASALLVVVVVAIKGGRRETGPTHQWVSTVSSAWSALSAAFSGSVSSGMALQFGDTAALNALSSSTVWAKGGYPFTLGRVGDVFGQQKEPNRKSKPTSQRLFDEALELRDVFSPEPEADDLRPSCRTLVSPCVTQSQGPSPDELDLCHVNYKLKGYTARCLYPTQPSSRVERPWLVEFELPNENGYAPSARVSWVHTGGFGRLLGLRRGDIIVSVNGVPCGSSTQLDAAAALNKWPASAVTRVTVFRIDLEGGTRFS